MGQVRMFKEPVIGWAHPSIFWGFCLFVVASALLFLGGMFPDWPIPQVEQIPVLGTLVDLFAVIVTVGLIAAAMRRYFFTPPGLQRTFDASFILVLIAGLMVTFVLAEAGESFEGQQTFLPIGQGLAKVLLTLGVAQQTIQTVGHVAWWIHVLILLVFLVYLPYSKHMHLMWAPFGVFFAELPHKGMLISHAMQEGQELSSPLEIFTWRMLLGAYSCAECGRCERACPAFNSGSKLSPRELSHDFKEFVMREGFGQRGNGSKAKAEKSICELLGGHMSAEVIWACTTCYACMDACPVRNEHVPLIVQLRRKLMDEGALDGALQEAMTSLQRYGNSLGKSARKRFEWAKDLPTPLKDAQKEPVDFLWFLGDYAAYHPSSARVSRMVAQTLQDAGVDFGVLAKGEKSAGNDVRRSGEEGLFEMLREQNMEALHKADFKQIVTTDPHTYHTLKHEYPDLSDKSILHYSELFEQCLQSGKLQVKNRLAGRVVFHDPCYLGRINGIYAPPRRVIDALGLQRVEMPRCLADSYCCGAGGGKIWMEEEEGITERPAVSRIREALAIDGVTRFVVACPKDLGMFEDAVKTVGAEDRLKIVDLGELVFEATSSPTAVGTQS
jgi:Fe-S oxidoreductase/nitrate reductase gamma subunit